MTHTERLPCNSPEIPDSSKPTEHPPRYFAPVCIRTPLGFLGGPAGYCEVSESEKGQGPIVIETTNCWKIWVV